MKKQAATLSCILLLAGCDQQPPKKLDVDMKNPDGDSLGKITLEQKADGLKLSGDLQGLPQGDLAIHIHDKGKCKPPDFLSAGNHFNPEKKEHGLMNQKGAHAGDLPNLSVDEEGTAKVDTMAKGATLEDGKMSLYTKEGTSIVIHDKPDDGKSQPAGDSGKRIACGEISKDRKPAK
ncbi:MAG TPA: superoxide dismutase family protein [Bacillaceae bacterium]